MFSFFNTKPKENFKEGTIEYETLKQQLEAVIEVNRAMAGILDIDEVLKLITSKLVSVINVSYAVIFVWDEINQKVNVKSITIPGFAQTLIQTALGKPIEEVSLSVKDPEESKNDYVQSILQEKILISNDLSTSAYPFLSKGLSRTLQPLLSMKLAVSIPLIMRGQKLGVLGIIWKNDTLNEDIKTLILTFANQISTTIYNSRLFSQVKTQVSQLELKNEDLTSLYNLTSQISKSLDIATVAQTAVNSLPQDKFIIGSVLAEYHKESNALQNIALTENALYFQVTKIIQDPKQYKLELGGPGSELNLAVKAYKQGIPQYSNELKDFLAPTLPGPLISAVEAVLQIKSVASYPLIIRGVAIGTLTFLIKDKTAEELSESEKQLLGTYTYHITIALENAELYKQQKLTQANLETALAEVQALRQHEQDMIDIMGHELRTPISIVRNALGMLEMELHNTGEIKKENLGKFLDISMESARREVKLVETLLSSAKADSRGFQLLFEKVDFLDVVNDSMEFFVREAEKKNIQIKYTKPTEEIFVFADRTRIQEVMDNLLSNAVKYTDTGFIKINVRVQDGFAWIEVTDTGIGMSEQDLKSIGQKFYRVDQYMDNGPAGAPKTEKPNIIRPGGTGLGLYVTFSLVKVMDGKIDVKSQIGVGSTFSFGMPLYEGQESKQEQRKP
ncbi:MAG: ATP-binding protein [Candidatus Dojkabacteria bacterium]